MLKKLFIVSCISLALAACSSAPTKEQVKESVKRIIPVAFEVLEVRELKEIPGLYEVVLKADKQPIVLYMDKKAKYVLSGSLMSLETKSNLTMETQKKYLQK
jgi:protein-disulfide isomerase